MEKTQSQIQAAIRSSETAFEEVVFETAAENALNEVRSADFPIEHLGKLGPEMISSYLRLEAGIKEFRDKIEKILREEKNIKTFHEKKGTLCYGVRDLEYALAQAKFLRNEAAKEMKRAEQILADDYR